jgi:hypothetical protein
MISNLMALTGVKRKRSIGMKNLNNSVFNPSFRLVSAQLYKYQ